MAFQNTQLPEIEEIFRFPLIEAILVIAPEGGGNRANTRFAPTTDAEISYTK